VKGKRLGTIIGLATLAAMFGYLALQRDILEAIRTIPVWMAIVIVVVSGGALVIQAVQFRTAVRIQQIDMPLLESTALTAANTMANYYLPVRGGMVVRAAYMKRVYRFPLARYGALTVSITGLTILVAALIGVVGIVIAAVIDGELDRRALLVFGSIGGAVVLGMTIAMLLTGFAKGGGRLAEIVTSFRAGIAMWVDDRGGLAVFLFWTVALFAAQGFRLWLSFRAVGVSVSFSGMMIIQGMAAVAFVFALTPGNVGIKEGAVVFSASLLGIDPDIALLASLIDRAAALVVTFGVGLASVRFLSRRTAIGSADAAESPPDPGTSEH
jgi:uncharacterized protein (TIRG00374 family)